MIYVIHLASSWFVESDLVPCDDSQPMNQWCRQRFNQNANVQLQTVSAEVRSAIHIRSMRVIRLAFTWFVDSDSIPCDNSQTMIGHPYVLPTYIFEHAFTTPFQCLSSHPLGVYLNPSWMTFFPPALITLHHYYLTWVQASFIRVSEALQHIYSNGVDSDSIRMILCNYQQWSWTHITTCFTWNV